MKFLLTKKAIFYASCLGLCVNFVYAQGELFENSLRKESLESSTVPDCTGEEIFLEENGLVAFEAEHYTAQFKTDVRQWYFQDGSIDTPLPDVDPSHHEGASGDGYLEILPDTRATHSDRLIQNVNFTSNQGRLAVLEYKIKFTTPGKYFVWGRVYSTGTEDNGMHVGIDGTWPGSGKQMQWCSGKNQWTWESRRRTSARHCGEQMLSFININEPGVHTFMISMRKDGFELDKIVLSKEYVKPRMEGPNEVLVCSEEITSTTSNLSIANADLYQIYPSPSSTSDAVRIRGLVNGERYEVKIFDLYGAQKGVYTISGSESLDINSLVSGTYLAQICNLDDPSSCIVKKMFVIE